MPVAARRFRQPLRLARGLVAGGIVVGAIWLAISGALVDVATIESAWESWLPALLGVALAPLLALAALGFMTHNSTGGCRTWATILLGWLALYEGASHAAALFPVVGPSFGGGWQAGVAMGAVATPLFTALTAMAMAQLLVVAAGGGREENS